MTSVVDDELDLQTEQVEDEEAIASFEHGAIGSTLIMYLNQYVRANKLGRVFDAQTTFTLKGKKPARQPDVAFVSADRFPKDWRNEADFAPDLAAEVSSKYDRTDTIEAKVLQYQNSGVRLVWILHTYSQTVEVFRLNKGLRSQRFMEDDELDGYDVIPGFKVKVSELFEGVPRAADKDLADQEQL